MKLCVLIWLIICTNNIRCPQEITKELTSVFNIPEVEILFLELHDHKLKPASPLEPKESQNEAETHTNSESALDAVTKEEICTTISSSGFFFLNSRYPYSPLNKKHMPKKSLMIQHPIIFSHLFAMVKDEKKHMMPQYHHEMKQSKEREVYIGNHPHMERTFRCIDREGSKKKLDEFYVSDREYNVSGNRMENIAGRFIFWFDHEDNRIELSALAEEPALIISENAESFYAQLKKDPSLTLNLDNDPLCGLSPGQKVRLCSSVMNGIENKVHDQMHVEFYPTMYNMNAVCKLRKISIKEGQENHSHYEYIITCNARGGMAYHLFQGYGKDRVFVAQTETEKTQTGSSTVTYVHYYANRLAVLN